MPFRLVLSVIVAALVLAGPGRADMPVFYSSDGAAIGGYDTVAYFRSGSAVPGRREITVMWKGAVWRFASQTNREAFEANPRAYAPQYGGYCAYAVSRGHVAGTDPEAWRIVDGKLYLIHSRSILEIWARDPKAHIARSKANWPAVLFE